jgi:hypothetical protein
MQTTRKPFVKLKAGDAFIHGGVIYKKISAYKAVNMHNLRTTTFKLDQFVEVAPE